MKRIACPVFLSVLLFSACNNDTATSKPPPQAPAKPAETAKAPAETPKAPTAPSKPAEMTAKTPAEPAKPADMTAKPAEAAKTPAAAADMDASITALMAKPEVADAQIQVQHILIAFKGSLPGVSRSKEEAKALAEKVYAQVVSGGDFDALVKEYTNDSAPGIYPITKAGRASMVKGFGDVGFRLKVGEIGVAPFDAKASPYGWHIIKRLK